MSYSMRIGILSAQNDLRRWGWSILLALCFCGTGLYGQGNDPDTPAPSDQNISRWSVHAQATAVGEAHSSFAAAYSGTNSLDPRSETKPSLTTTLFLGLRVWNSLELFANPEVAGGKGFSNVLGMAGFPNGEITRVTKPVPRPYLSRIFIRQTWGLGGDREQVQDGANQLAGSQAVSRLTLTFGKIAAPDIFDTNSYSHDPRIQFMNWALMENGVWDYPADTRGYTWGGALELNLPHWAFRAGSFLVSTYANGMPMDRHFRRNNGEVVELEARRNPFGHAGKVKLLAYVNHAHMGNYRLAILEDPTAPNIIKTQRSDTPKYGLGLDVEQSLSPSVGAFLRAGWDDGRTETWEFTEIDRTLHGGVEVHGIHWHRPHDAVGVAGVVNGVSRDHRDYLGAGGYGFILGDGRLNYALERIPEAYYAWHLQPMLTLTVDYQFCANPAYNRDRGPVSIWGIRLHWEK
jgi:high affinity Mn2+ porin